MACCSLLKFASHLHSMERLFVGISVGGFPGDVTVAAKVLEEAIKLSGNNAFVVLIADSLDRFNYMAGGKSEAKSRRKAIQKGQQLVNLFKQAQCLVPESQNLVKIVQWDDVYSQSHYKECMKAVAVKFEEDEEFRALIEDVAVSVARNRDKRSGDKEVSTTRKEASVKYILEELPALTVGFIHENIWYNYLMHPLFLNGSGPCAAGIKLRKVCDEFNFSPRYDNVRKLLLQPPVLWCNIRYVDINFSPRNNSAVRQTMAPEVISASGETPSRSLQPQLCQLGSPNSRMKYGILLLPP